MSGEWDDAPLGYKQPPQWSRFKKGQSGNPNGRPKKRTAVSQAISDPSAVDDLLRQALKRKVRINDANGSREVEMLEAVIMAQVTSAAKGNVYAQRDVLRQAQDLVVRDARRQAAEEETRSQTFLHILNMRRDQARTWADAESHGAEPLNCWPHPDDILIDKANQQWRIRGPMSTDHLPFYEYCRAQRDQLFFWSVIERRRRGRQSRAAVQLWDVCWLAFDQLLPLRWQLWENVESVLAFFMTIPMGDVRTMLKRGERRVEEWRLRAGQSAPDKDCYRVANEVMKPLLNSYGYRSLAEFNAAYALHGDTLPWPKPRTGALRSG